MDRCLLWTGVCYGQVSAMDRCLLWTGVCYGQVSAMDRCLLWTGVCYGQVSAMDRCLLWTGVRCISILVLLLQCKCLTLLSIPMACVSLNDRISQVLSRKS